MSFVPNRDLLNSKFEGYKLSESPLHYVSQTFNGSVHKIDTKNLEHFSYQRMRQATMYNHLVPDPWDGNRVYWISAENQNIMCGTLLETKELIITTVYHNTVTTTSPRHSTTNSTLFFLSKTLAIHHCDGNICIYYTGVRDTFSLSSWQLMISIPFVVNSPEVTLHSASLNDINLDLLTFILLLDKPDCIWVWNRITFSRPLINEVISSNGPPSLQYNVVQCCTFITHTICTHSQFINEGQHLMIISDSLPYMEVVQSEVKEREENNEVEMDTYTGIGYKDNYTWEQTENDITILIQLPVDVTKKDIVCNIKKDELLVGLNDGTIYIRGTLWNGIDIDTSTWIIQDNKILQVILEKINTDIVWPLLMKEKDQETIDLPLPIETSQHVHQLLSEMRGRKRSNSNNNSVPSNKQAIFQSSLEECDTIDDKDHTICVLSINGSIEQKITLGGKQVLYTLPLIITLRHDIDALLYTISPTTSLPISFTHINTFNALGYVQASKRDKKFLTSSTNGSCAALADSCRHVFIYLQPSQGSVYASQYIHTLPYENSNILGLAVSDNNTVYILTDNSLTVCIV